jgi:hypothetical protein
MIRTQSNTPAPSRSRGLAPHTDLVLEVEERCELSALVISSQHEQRLRIGDLECVEVEHDFSAEAAAVDVIAEEEVLRVLRVSTDLEQSNEVEELSVDIAADGDRVLQLQHVRLRLDDGRRAVDQVEGGIHRHAAFLQKMLLQDGELRHACASAEGRSRSQSVVSKRPIPVHSSSFALPITLHPTRCDPGSRPICSVRLLARRFPLSSHCCRAGFGADPSCRAVGPSRAGTSAARRRPSSRGPSRPPSGRVQPWRSGMCREDVNARDGWRRSRGASARRRASEGRRPDGQRHGGTERRDCAHMPGQRVRCVRVHVAPAISHEGVAGAQATRAEQRAASSRTTGSADQQANSNTSQRTPHTIRLSHRPGSYLIRTVSSCSANPAASTETRPKTPHSAVDGLRALQCARETVSHQ